MKVSWKWLSQIIDLSNIEFNELTEKLTMAGFEIEETYELIELQDKIIELKLTANRQDTSFLIGLAREISTLLNKPLKNYYSQIKPNRVNKTYNHISSRSLEDLKLNIIININNKHSPKWIQNYLKSYNIKTTHLLNDIIEYVNLKWGQDIEIFDAKKIGIQSISNDKIQISNTDDISQILDKKNHSYYPNPEIVKCNNTILSIIGIKSNDSIKCDLNTSSVIICGTICQSTYIQSIIKQLNIKTEKSTKHRKKILRCDFLYAYEETIRLISTFAQGIVGKSYTYHSVPYKQKNLLVSKQNIHHILGPIKNHSSEFLSVKKILNTLNQLNFMSTYNDMKQVFIITIPEYRIHDIKRPIDVIEEIGRIYGFKQFYDDLPEAISKGITSNKRQIIKTIRKILRDLGIHEVIHYSLKKKNKYYQNNTNLIELYNPLSEDQNVLQNSLFTNLLEIQQYNINQRNFSIEAFEIGHIFIKDQIHKDCINTQQNQENICVACIMGKPNFSRSSWTDKPKELSWFHAKGILEEFFEKLQATVEWKKFTNSDIAEINQKVANLFNLKKTSTIYNPRTKENIGFFGQLDYLNNYGIEYYPTYMFEIQLSALMRTINHIDHLNYRIKPYSSYPSITRDISIKLKSHENIDIIRQRILNQNNNLLESIEIFNEYKHNRDKRKISLRITYRAQDRTLGDTDVNKINEQIKYMLNQNKE
uniref:phenylalanyl-tRNA synthetase subunit beta n=1 Tax=Grateloupia asiatica TaxID=151735 RepID=UPI002A825AB9|nr:phenylalanyl-tRNA synthetase subunit beta [Grateloupia asiatica]WOL36815.1 phenylalanyl-tRNA synthetase subunit beta [Grateloupia asiatica]